MTTFEVSKYMGISEHALRMLIRYCESFPHPEMVRKSFVHNDEKITKWFESHNVENETRYAYTAKNRNYAQTKYEYDHPEVKIDKNLMLDIRKFIRCTHAPWRKFENKSVYDDYLSTEKNNKQLQFNRRIGLC